MGTFVPNGTGGYTPGSNAGVGCPPERIDGGAYGEGTVGCAGWGRPAWPMFGVVGAEREGRGGEITGPGVRPPMGGTKTGYPGGGAVVGITGENVG